MSIPRGQFDALRTLGLEKTAGPWWLQLPELMQAGSQLAPALGHAAQSVVSGAGHALASAPGHAWNWAQASLPALGMHAAGMHLAANVANKGLRMTRAGKWLERKTLAAGLRHGLEGKQLSPVIQGAVTRVAGPEYMQPYALGQQIAKPLQTATAEQRTNVLNSLGRTIQDSAHLAASPIGYAPEALAEVAANPQTGGLARRLLREQGKANWLERGAVTAGNLALDTVSPPLAAHTLVNIGRDALARSSVGRRAIQEGLALGGVGFTPTRGQQVFKDLVFSPALLDPQRTAYALNQAVRAAPVQTAQNINALRGALADIPATQRSARIGKAFGYLDQQLGHAGRDIPQHVGPLTSAVRDVVQGGQGVYDYARQGRLREAVPAMEMMPGVVDVAKEKAQNLGAAFMEAGQRAQEAAPKMEQGVQNILRTGNVWGD